MSVRCPTCGEVAYEDDARFCVGCGGSLAGALPVEPPPVVEPEPEPEPVVEPPPVVEPEPAPGPAPAPEPVTTRRRPPTGPFIDAPPASAAQRPPPPPAASPPPPPTAFPELRPKEPVKLPPLVPTWMVIAGVLGIVALLVVLLLSG